MCSYLSILPRWRMFLCLFLRSLLWHPRMRRCCISRQRELRILKKKLDINYASIFLKRCGCLVWPMGPQAEGRGFKSRPHLWVWNPCAKLFLKFTTSLLRRPVQSSKLFSAVCEVLIPYCVCVGTVAQALSKWEEDCVQQCGVNRLGWWISTYIISRLYF